MNPLDIVKKYKRGGRHTPGFIEIVSSEGVKGYLRPVKANEKYASLMAKWRAENFDKFFTCIKPGENDLLRWLRHYEDNDNEIIFIVEDMTGISIGQMALYHIDFDQGKAEFGRIIRGEKNGPVGIMAHASEAILSWGFGTLELKRVFLHVFSDNEHAISLYKSLGFHVSDNLLFRRIRTSQGIVKWVKVEKGPESSHNRDQYRKVYKMYLGRKDLGI